MLAFLLSIVFFVLVMGLGSTPWQPGYTVVVGCQLGILLKYVLAWRRVRECGWELTMRELFLNFAVLALTRRHAIVHKSTAMAMPLYDSDAGDLANLLRAYHFALQHPTERGRWRERIAKTTDALLVAGMVGGLLLDSLLRLIL